jgi:hypothetical protein
VETPTAHWAADEAPLLFTSVFRVALAASVLLGLIIRPISPGVSHRFHKSRPGYTSQLPGISGLYQCCANLNTPPLQLLSIPEYYDFYAGHEPAFLRL